MENSSKVIELLNKQMHKSPSSASFLLCTTVLALLSSNWAETATLRARLPVSLDDYLCKAALIPDNRSRMIAYTVAASIVGYPDDAEKLVNEGLAHLQRHREKCSLESRQIEQFYQGFTLGCLMGVSTIYVGSGCRLEILKTLLRDPLVPQMRRLPSELTGLLSSATKSILDAEGSDTVKEFFRATKDLGFPTGSLLDEIMGEFAVKLFACWNTKERVACLWEHMGDEETVSL